MGHNAVQKPTVAAKQAGTYVKLPAEKRKQIEELAAEVGCSMSDVIRAAIYAYLARKSRKSA